MLTQRQMEMAQAVNTLDDEAFAASGMPKVEPLSDALEALGFSRTNADERTAEWAALLEDAAKAQMPDDPTTPMREIKALEMVEITVTDSATSPIEIRVNGVAYSFTKGVPCIVPGYVVDALSCSDVSFTEVLA